eukprot:TRINITY_DN5521_c2_g2_i3.p1 TRINITY_DN5521_c2_g2~~TRINITY_DN5521_c2_g2_i3.p1  ORF type:complete len:225 (+),score=23.41 TRINITY_DN5521_c2_g2_i3:28-675(+)
MSSSASSSSSGDVPIEWPSTIPLLNSNDVIFSRSDSLGLGGSGQVFWGTYKGERVAIKQFFADKDKAKNDQIIRDFQKELNAFSVISSSPYVVHIHGAYIDGNTPVIVMEYLEKGDLYDFIMVQGPDFKCGHPLWDRFLYDICKGMSVIHAAGLIHRDLKLPNILVVSNDPDLHSSTIKICDSDGVFGKGRPLRLHHGAGTRLQMWTSLVGQVSL